MPESEAWRVHSCSTVSVIVQGTGKDNDHRYTLYAEKDSRSEAGIRTSHDNLFVRSTAESLNHRKTKQNQTSKARISQDSDTPDSHSQDGNMQSRRPQPVKTDTIKMAIWSRRIQSRWQFGQDGYNQDGNLVKTDTIKMAIWSRRTQSRRRQSRPNSYNHSRYPMSPSSSRRLPAAQKTKSTPYQNATVCYTENKNKQNKNKKSLMKPR